MKNDLILCLIFPLNKRIFIMQSDAFFWIGKTHKINQDYALSGVKDGIHYAIVSDGCSSSPHTDFGSRLLTRAALAHIEKANRPKLFGELVINTAKTYADAIALPVECLDATLLVTAAIGDLVYTLMFGDGVIRIEERNYEATFQADYPENAPYYLSYLLSEKRNNTILGLINSSDKNIYTAHYQYPDGGSYVESGPDRKAASFPWKTWIHNKKDIRMVALMSDGVESYQKQVETDTSISFKNVDYMDIVEELLSFKLTKGQFVQRRALSFIKNSKHLQHSDDVSIAVLYNEDYSQRQ